MMWRRVSSLLPGATTAAGANGPAAHALLLLALGRHAATISSTTMVLPPTRRRGVSARTEATPTRSGLLGLLSGTRISPLSAVSSMGLTTAAPSKVTSSRGQHSGVATAVPGAAQYQCSACQKTFRLPNALSHHIATRHAGDATSIPLGADGKPLAGAPATTAAGGTAAPSHASAKAAVAAAATAAVAAEQQRKTAAPASPTATPSAPRAPAASSPETSAASSKETATAEQPAAASAVPPSDEDVDKKLFVCTVCAKGFRIEAALNHHYMAKHNMEPPSSASATGATSSAATAASPATGGASDAAEAPLTDAAARGVAQPVHPTGQQQQAPTSFSSPQQPAAAASSMTQQFIQSAESIHPQPPPYHLDAYPNAPEEGDIAAHSRCVNSVLLVGTVTDVQRGYIFEEQVTQFVLVTDFEGAPVGDPDKDYHTVRLFAGPPYAPLDPGYEEVCAGLTDGARVLVSGRLRMIPQYEVSMSKYYHFPVVHVHAGSGYVRPLGVISAEGGAATSAVPPK